MSWKCCMRHRRSKLARMEEVPQRWVLSNLLLNQEVRRFYWCTSAWKKSVWMHRRALVGLSAEVNCLHEWSQTHFTGKVPVSRLVSSADDSVIAVSLRCHYQSFVVNVRIILYIIAFLSSVAWNLQLKMYLEDINSVFCKRKRGGHPRMMNMWGILRFFSD